MNGNDIILPRKIYTLLGDKDNIEQLNIYFRNIITGYYKDKIVEVKCDYGRQYEDFWRIEPGNSNIPQYNVAECCFELKVQIKDYEFNILNEASTLIEVLPKTTKGKTHVLCIGDSITRWGCYIEHLTKVLPEAVSVGTRTYDNGGANKEGRGGWNAKSFLHKNTLDYPYDTAFQSPFMFPAGIEGSKFWGNAAFWQNVVDKDPEGYDYHGFQKIASGWKDDKGPYLFDKKGFPLNPAKGDVIFDPFREKGKNFIEWNGHDWAQMNNQPDWELSFTKYLQRYRCAFIRNGKSFEPDIISLLFGANDITSFDSLDVFIKSLEQIIASIKEYKQDMKVIINLPVSGSTRNQENKTSEYYRRLMQEGSRRILDKWDNDHGIKNNIYIGSMLLCVDPYYGYGIREESAFKYSEDRIKMPGDSIHPSINGHKQMGDLLAGIVQKIR